MSQSSSEHVTNRIQRLKQALQTDTVLTTQQITTHYGINPRQLKQHGLHTTRRLTKTHHTTHHYTPTTYVSDDPKHLKQKDSNLIHLTGTAEIRHQLNAPTHEWTIHPNHTNQNTPDATWNQNGTTATAIEYDTGSYNRTRIKEKTLAYHNYPGGQIWGTPTPQRTKNVQTITQQHDTRTKVIHANPTNPKPTTPQQ
jgi:hypothetical protein